MSSGLSSKSYLVSLVNILDINGLTEVEENDSDDTLGCDDDAHKVVLCNHSLILHVWLLFLDENGVTEVEENDSNDTIACDDDAHKVVLRNHSLILRAWLHLVMFFFVYS